MAFEYRWAASDRPAWIELAVTTRLSDGSPGDTSTAETATTLVNVPAGFYCGYAGPLVVLTAHVYLGTRHAITSWRITGGLQAILSAVGDFCTTRPDEPDHPTVGSGVATLEYSLDGSTWTEVDTFSLTAPVISGVGTATESFDHTRSVTSFTACQVRIVITHRSSYFSSNFSLSAIASLSDIRFSASDTGISCSNPSGGGGGSDDDGYSEDAPTSCSYAEDPATTCTYTEG